MKAVSTAVAGTNASSADYNTLQARAFGMRPASGGELAGTEGVDGVHAQLGTGFPNATPKLVDERHDWRDRVLKVVYCNLSAAANRPGGATDYVDWSTLGGISTTLGYTRLGAYDAGGLEPSAGNPPVPGAGPPASAAVQVFANFWLYADPSDGRLFAYNATGADVHLFFWIESTGDLGAH